jgi:hypothetical protein
MDIQKEFDRWWNTFKSQATRQYPVKAAREAWVACAMLMADRVKELELTCGVRGYDGLLKQLKEYEQQAKDNEGKDNIIIAELQAESVKWTHTAQYRLSQHLQTKLDEAVEIIKGFCDESFDEHPNCKYQRAERFLAKLDLLEEDR